MPKEFEHFGSISAGSKKLGWGTGKSKTEKYVERRQNKGGREVTKKHSLWNISLVSQHSFNARAELCVLGEIHSRWAIQQPAFHWCLGCESRETPLPTYTSFSKSECGWEYPVYCPKSALPWSVPEIWLRKYWLMPPKTSMEHTNNQTTWVVVEQCTTPCHDPLIFARTVTGNGTILTPEMKEVPAMETGTPQWDTALPWISHRSKGSYLQETFCSWSSQVIWQWYSQRWRYGQI